MIPGQGFAGGPTYAGFRYYSEMLGSGTLSDEVANAVNDFRETHMGTLSGMTRYEDRKHKRNLPLLVICGSTVILTGCLCFQTWMICQPLGMGIHPSLWEGLSLHWRYTLDTSRTISRVAFSMHPSTSFQHVLVQFLPTFCAF